jgi:hypothetical protein
MIGYQLPALSVQPSASSSLLEAGGWRLFLGRLLRR